MRFSGILRLCSFCMMCASGRPFRLTEKACARTRRASKRLDAAACARVSVAKNVMGLSPRYLVAHTWVGRQCVFWPGCMIRARLSFAFIPICRGSITAGPKREKEKMRERKGNFLCVCEQRAKYENESKRGSLHAEVEIKWPCSQPADSFFCPCARKLDNVRECEGRNGALNGQRRRPLPAGPVQEEKCFSIFLLQFKPHQFNMLAIVKQVFKH